METVIQAHPEASCDTVPTVRSKWAGIRLLLRQYCSSLASSSWRDVAKEPLKPSILVKELSNGVEMVRHCPRAY